MTSTVAHAAVFLSGAAGLSILLKATLFLALGLTAAWLARRERASVRHVLMAATFATLLALPFLVLLGPAVSIEIPIAAGDDAPAATNTTVPSGAVPATASVNTNTALARSKSSGPSWPTLAMGEMWSHHSCAEYGGRPSSCPRPRQHGATRISIAHWFTSSSTCDGWIGPFRSPRASHARATGAIRSSG